MPLHSKNRSVLLHSVALCSVATLFSTLQAETETWKISALSPGAVSELRIPSENTKKRLLMTKDPAITLADDAKLSATVLSFTGAQTGSVTAGLCEGASTFFLTTKIKPAVQADATVILHPGQYELRVAKNGTELQLYVTYPKEPSGQGTVSVTQPINPDQWNTIEASVRGTEAKLSVDGVEAKADVPAPGMKPTQAYLRLGSNDERRPYTGSIADLTVSEPAE